MPKGIMTIVLLRLFQNTGFNYVEFWKGMKFYNCKTFTLDTVFHEILKQGTISLCMHQRFRPFLFPGGKLS